VKDVRPGYTILIGDVLEQMATLPENSVHCCVTSPPYWGLRDYGVDGQIGLEATPEEFIAKMVAVFRAVRRVLREDGTLWLNIGDSYAGGRGGNPTADSSTLEGSLRNQEASIVKRQMTQSRRRDDAVVPRSDVAVDGLKPKDLLLMPWRVALALQADGWWVRSAVCWAKKSPMPESVSDRPTSSWEPIFLMAKSSRYFYDAEAVKEKSESTGGAAFGKVEQMDAAREAGQGARRYERPDYREIGRNQRNVWHLGPEPYPEAHFATFPTEIPRRAILAGTSEKGCCAACGAPWVRTASRQTNGMDTVNVHERTGDTTQARHGKAKCPSGLVVASRTTGWEAGCGCGAGVVPCTVLDPFLGSGTTLAVARQLGRVGVGVELNPEYVKLAHDRIGKAERPGTYRTQRADGTGGEEGGLFVANAECGGPVPNAGVGGGVRP